VSAAAAARQRAQRGDHVVPVVLAQFVREQAQGQREEQQADRRTCHMPNPLPHPGYRLAREIALHHP
jgi:hypothetical protein